MKNFLDYHFYVVFHTVITELFPLNWLECSLVDELERDQVFYRRKFQGSLTFGGKRLKDDYDYFESIHGIEPCERLDILILRGTEIYWEGYFSTSQGDWNLDDCTFTITPLPSDDYTDWSDYGSEEYDIFDVTPTYPITVVANGVSYTRNRFVFDVLEFLADKVFPGVTVTSRFFTEAVNYVTLKTNRLLYLTIAQKSDIKRPTSTNPATFAMLSFNELMWILKMFNVYWTYDLATNVLTVEHISLFTKTGGADLRNQKIAKGSNKYKYLKEVMPKFEKFSFMESENEDFDTNTIYYESQCVDQNPDTNTVEYSNRVTTDIEMIQTNPDAVSDEGWVIMANYEDSGAYYTYFLPGMADHTVRYNMYLSWSYLVDYYFRHNRILLEGIMNRAVTTFFSAKKTKVQEINAIICPAYLNDPLKEITTELGETYFNSAKGIVWKAVIKPYDEINFTLLYGEPDNPNTGAVTEPMVIHAIIEAGPFHMCFYLSEPATTDIYLWMYIKTDPLHPGTTACQEVVIPVGSTVYCIDIDDPGGIIDTIEWNLSDVSMNPWTLVVGDNEAYVLNTVDCTGVPPVPPVPVAPVISGITQLARCATVNIFWNVVADATYYMLQRKPNYAGSPSTWETVYSGTTNHAHDPDAGNATYPIYTYKVKACNISGCSAYSAEEEFEPTC